MLADGFDWWEEALDLSISSKLWEYLQFHKSKAIELDNTRCTPVSVEISEVSFQLLPTGAKGGREFVLINGSYRIEMASSEKNWCIKWRATSAALWHHPIEALREGLYDLLEAAGCTPKDPDDWQRLSRVDYCFDIHSPVFTGQMYPRIVKQTVCPSKTKVRGDFIVQKTAIETLTIGMGSNCQVQIYDKTKEITEASNKTWLYDIWSVDGDTGEIDTKDIKTDVWRVEIRLRKQWLKARKVNRPDAFMANIYELLAEAIYNRRLCQPNRDTNRRRWPMHPLFVMVLNRISNPTSFLNIDLRPTGRADVLKKIIKRNIAGSLRSLEVLYSREDEIFKDSSAAHLMMEIFREMLNDPDHGEKIRRSLEKYELVDSHR